MPSSFTKSKFANSFKLSGTKSSTSPYSDSGGKLWRINSGIFSGCMSGGGTHVSIWYLIQFICSMLKHYLRMELYMERHHMAVVIRMAGMDIMFPAGPFHMVSIRSLSSSINMGTTRYFPIV